jgi:Xaa-Pro aminopeptidase
MQPYLSRLQQLQTTVQTGQVVLIAHPNHIFYLTGFQAITANEREAYFVVSSTSATLFAAAFSPLPQYLEQEKSLPLSLERTLRISKVHEVIQSLHPHTLLLDEEHLFLSEAKELEHQFKQSDTLTPPFKALDHQQLWDMRMLKDEHEMTYLKKAAVIVCETLQNVLQSLRVGITEKEIAFTIEATFRKLGADGPAFPTIVAFGEHGALPHYQPGNTPLQNNTSVLIDCGACVEGYNSDMTRTVWFGDTPSQEFLDVKQIVDTAYNTGVELLRRKYSQDQGITAADLDKAVREFIESKGYGKNYIHTTGHGIGLEVHEPPSLYLAHNTPLLKKMVVTIEPGIYLPGKLGYRHENTIFISGQAVEELTQ